MILAAVPGTRNELSWLHLFGTLSHLGVVRLKSISMVGVAISCVGIVLIFRAILLALGRIDPAFYLKAKKEGEKIPSVEKLQPQLRSYELCVTLLLGINALIFPFSKDFSGILSVLGCLGIFGYLLQFNSDYRMHPVPNWDKMGFYYLFFYAALYLMIAHGVSYPFGGM